MKKFFTTTAMLAAMTAGTTAQAQDWYASVFAGGTTGGSIDTGYSGSYQGEYYSGEYSIDLSGEFDNSYILGVTIGREVAPSLRADAELSYAKYSIGTNKFSITYSGTEGSGGFSESFPAEDGDEVGVTYLMGNLWYDIPMSGGMGMTPYVGGGLGIALVTDESDGPETFDDSNGIAYQVGAGVQFPVGAGAIDVGYRYKAVTGISLESDNFDPDFDLDDADLASNHFQVAYQMKF